MNPEDQVLRRTIHISNVPHECTDGLIIDLFREYGQIVQVKIEAVPKSDSFMALVEFASEDSAYEALKTPQVRSQSGIMRITPSRVTINVIPPTDAVFGKPMTLGRHVMAVNPTGSSSQSSYKRDDIMRAVHKAALKIAIAASDRPDCNIDAAEIDRLRQLSR